MEITETTEEILENLAAMYEENGDVRKNILARKVDISVNDLENYLEELESMKYLKVRKDHIVPTKKGLRIGRRIVRKHRLLERFLHDVLGISKDKVHNEACRLEHALSDEAEAALCRYLKHPNQCPDDKRPIPVCEMNVCSCEECGAESGTSNRHQLVPLTRLDMGTSGRVRFIRGGRKAVQRLRDMGLIPDIVVKVIKKTPFRGPVELEVCSTKLALGRRIAEKVYVEVC